VGTGVPSSGKVAKA